MFVCQRETCITRRCLKDAVRRCGRWRRNTWRWFDSTPPAACPTYERTSSSCGTTRMSASVRLHVCKRYRNRSVCSRLRFRLQIHQDLREELAKVKTLQALAEVSKQLRLRCQVTQTAAFAGARHRHRCLLLNKRCVCCRRRSPEERRWMAERAACRSPTGSVSHTSAQRECVQVKAQRWDAMSTQTF